MYSILALYCARLPGNLTYTAAATEEEEEEEAEEEEPP
jgi:hypothetical protein